MTLNDALEHFKTKKELAACLGITKQAVSQWAPNKEIPKRHSLRLKYEILPARSRANVPAA